MELGQRLFQARREAGLSQRQLCGDYMTRNMLSQIEHGTARPSMDTLRYLAGRLGKPVSYFLEEEAVMSPNQAPMARARAAWESGDAAGVLAALEAFRGPDATFDRERALLQNLANLALAEEALDAGRKLYALELLARVQEEGYCGGDLQRRKLLLLARAKEKGLEEICRMLPSLDEELCLRGRAALEAGEVNRAAALLDAAGDRDTRQWYLLRGRVDLEAGQWERAAAHFHRVEDTCPEVYPLLERCYRELEDFRRAYEYACKQKR